MLPYPVKITRFRIRQTATKTVKKAVFRIRIDLSADPDPAFYLNVDPDPVLDPVAKFIVPEWGIKSILALGCRTGPPAYVAWRAGTTILCRSQLYPPSQGYEFGYRFYYHSKFYIS